MRSLGTVIEKQAEGVIAKLKEQWPDVSFSTATAEGDGRVAIILVPNIVQFGEPEVAKMEQVVRQNK